MCRRVCHNQIKEDSNLDLTGFQIHNLVNFPVTQIFTRQHDCAFLLQNDVSEFAVD